MTVVTATAGTRRPKSTLAAEARAGPRPGYRYTTLHVVRNTQVVLAMTLLLIVVRE